MIKISRISSPLKDKIKNIDLCSQLDGDGSFEGNYNTTGTVLLRNSFSGNLVSDQTIVDAEGVFNGEMKCSELIIAGKVNGKIIANSIIIMETGRLSGNISYKQLAVFEGGIIDVEGMTPSLDKDDSENVIDISKKTKIET
tara:strand:+ start:70 stop:492 length:423 start_codon:yes stop_codon:yes gene_type:complete